MPFLEIAGRRIEYLRIGRAERLARPMVFLHEGLGSIALWQDFPARLAMAAGSEAMLYNRAGHGHSSAVPTPRSARFMHEEALDVLPLVLEALDIDRPLLVGHSDGASIALIFAAQFPERVAALALEAPHVVVEDRTVASIASARCRFRAGPLRDSLRKYHFENTEQMFESWAEVWLSPKFRAWSLEPELSAVRCPLLVIQGEDDEYGTARQVDLVERGAGGPVTRVILPRCGHVPHRERARDVLDAMRTFAAAIA